MPSRARTIGIDVITPARIDASGFSRLRAAGRSIMNTTLPARPRADATATAFGTPDTLAEFLSLALADPATAARRLAAWFDDRSPGSSSSFYDDAGALDDVADGDLDAADWVAVLARDRRYPLDVRLGLAAVVAGVRARRDDLASSLGNLPVRR